MSYFKNISRTLAVALLLGLSLSFIQNQRVEAVSNNNQYILPSLIENLRTSGNPTIANSNANGGGYYSFKSDNITGCNGTSTSTNKQVSKYWLSNYGQPKIQKQTINSNDDIARVQANFVGLNCDAALDRFGFFRSDFEDYSRILDSRFNLVSTTLRIINANGDVVHTQPLSSGAPVTINYQQTYNAAGGYLRWATNPDNTPVRKPFTISGLANLNLPAATYTLSITSKARIVHSFYGILPGPQTNYNTKRYYCQAFENGTIEQSEDGLTGTNCGTTTIGYSSELVVNPQSTPVQLSCSLQALNLPGNVASPGQTFSVRVTASNEGTSFVSVEDPNIYPRFIFAGPDNSEWGSGTSRFEIKSTVNGAFGPLLEPGKSSYVDKNFVVPDYASGQQSLYMRILRLPSAGVEENKTYTTCKLDLQVKINEPFIKAAGADVYSGAKFSDLDTGWCETYDTTKAVNANVTTNGFGSYNIGGFQGFSSSQYATFASGTIANGESGGHYSANLGFIRGEAKDLEFANNNGSEMQKDSYGKFYGIVEEDNQASIANVAANLPCLDYSEHIQAARDTNNAFNTLQAAFTGAGFADEFMYGIRTGNLNANGIPGGGSLPTESQISDNKRVLLVEGDMNVTGDIILPTNYTNSSDVPYLQIIVLGNVNIASSVSRIDAHIVSMPVANGSGGKVDLCSNANPGPGAGAWGTGSSAQSLTIDSCDNKLTINGSLVAKTILWKRTFGTIGNSDTAIDASCAVGNTTYTGSNSNKTQQLSTRNSTCSSELIDFSPETYLAAPSVLSGESSEIINTQELPPIY